MKVITYDPGEGHGISPEPGDLLLPIGRDHHPTGMVYVIHSVREVRRRSRSTAGPRYSLFVEPSASARGGRVWPLWWARR